MNTRATKKRKLQAVKERTAQACNKMKLADLVKNSNKEITFLDWDVCCYKFEFVIEVNNEDGYITLPENLLSSREKQLIEFQQKIRHLPGICDETIGQHLAFV